MVSRTISFGKIDARGSGRKANLVEVTVSLKMNRNGFPEFSASGDVWNTRMTDIIMGGQCLDHIRSVPINNTLFQEIKQLWKKYHLNGMNAGTKAQEEALKKVGLGAAADYYKACEYLKSKGLYEVKLTATEAKYNPQYAGKPYRYGSGWLYRPIPAADLAKIRRIVTGVQ